MPPTLPGPLAPPGRLSAVDPSPLPIDADAERPEARDVERGALLERDVAERIALPLRPPADEEPAAPTAVGSAWEVEVEATPVEIAAPVVVVPPPVELPPLDPPDPPPLDELPPDERPPLELPEEPPLLNEPDGPLRPKLLRLPRICGVISDTNFSAWVVPVSRRIFSTVPSLAAKVRTEAWTAVSDGPLRV